MLVFNAWVRSLGKMLPYVKFSEDKVLVFVIQERTQTVLRRGRAFARQPTVRDWTLSCAAPSDMVTTVRKTLQQSVTNVFCC